MLRVQQPRASDRALFLFLLVNGVVLGIIVLVLELSWLELQKKYSVPWAISIETFYRIAFFTLFFYFAFVGISAWRIASGSKFRWYDASFVISAGLVGLVLEDVLYMKIAGYPMSSPWEGPMLFPWLPYWIAISLLIVFGVIFIVYRRNVRVYR